MAGRKRKAGKVKAERTMLKLVRPTDEQMARSQYESAGPAYRKVAVIETLWKAGKLTAAEYDNLLHYRTQAHQAEDDAAQCGTLAPEKIMGGGGSAPGSRIPASLVFTPASVETGRIERDLGSLLDIAHAVAVDDLTLSQWCIEKHGGRERYNGRGEFVAVVPIAEKRHLQLALLDLKHAAGRFSR